MTLSWVDYVLWALAIGLEAWLVVLVPRSRYPALFAYVASCLARDVLLVPVFATGSYAAYFYTYWTLQVAGLFLQGWMIGELIRETRVETEWVMLTLVGTCLLVVSLPMAVSVVMVIAAVQRAVYFVRAAVFVLVLIEWGRMRRIEVQIAAGVGLFSAMELIVALLRTTFGITRNPVLDRSQVGFFLLALLTWVTAFWPPKPKVLDAAERK